MGILGGYERWVILILNELAGTPGVIRTPDPLLRRQVLYPAELRAQSVECLKIISGGQDLNLRTFRSQTGRSTKLSYRPSSMRFPKFVLRLRSR